MQHGGDGEQEFHLWGYVAAGPLWPRGQEAGVEGPQKIDREMSF